MPQLPVISTCCNSMPSTCNYVTNPALHCCSSRLIHQPVSSVVSRIPSTLYYSTPVFHYPSLITSSFYPSNVQLYVPFVQVQVNSDTTQETKQEEKVDHVDLEIDKETFQATVENEAQQSEKISIESKVEVDLSVKVI
jgi:hypothetical protein